MRKLSKMLPSEPYPNGRRVPPAIMFSQSLPPPFSQEVTKALRVNFFAEDALVNKQLPCLNNVMEKLRFILCCSAEEKQKKSKRKQCWGMVLAPAEVASTNVNPWGPGKTKILIFQLLLALVPAMAEERSYRMLYCVTLAWAGKLFYFIGSRKSSNRYYFLALRRHAHFVYVDVQMKGGPECLSRTVGLGCSAEMNEIFSYRRNVTYVKDVSMEIVMNEDSVKRLISTNINFSVIQGKYVSLSLQ